MPMTAGSLIDSYTQRH